MTRALTVIVLAALLALGAPATGADPGPAPSAALADLRITALVVEAGALVPNLRPPPRNITLVVANDGTVDATDVLVELSEIRPDGRRSVHAAGSLALVRAAESVQMRLRWTPPVDTVGDLDMVAVADPYGTVPERDDRNNARHARAAVGVPLPGFVYPALSARSIGEPHPVYLGGEWASFAFDTHDRHNPIPGLLLDRSGHGHDARMPPSPAPAAGVAGLGARFDGRSVYAVDWNGQAAGAGVSFWLRIDERPQFGQFVWSVPAGECRRQAVELRPEGHLRLWAPSPSGGCVNALESLAKVLPGRWTHVAVSWAGGTATLYVDGEPQGALAMAGAPTPVHGSLYIGGLNLNDGPQTPSGMLDKATVDEFRIYSRALSPADVAALRAMHLPK